MSAVFNKDNMVKASKWAFFALFGVVLVVLKVIWAFIYGILFGQESKPSYDADYDTTWGRKQFFHDPDYDEHGHKY